MGVKKDTFVGPIFINNPITIQVLGICSSLAVTTQLKTALVMGLSVTAVVAMSNLLISMMRNHIPPSVRIIIEMTVIASFVIIVDQFLKAYLFEISKQLSVFVGLIITNCILMGRAEAFAIKNPPLLSFLDGLGNGLGYGMILVIVGAIRELAGSGRLFGFEIFKMQVNGGWYVPNGMFLLAPSGFFIIATIIWFVKEREKRIRRG
ncbi:MAG: NADH:ubiquinone reductase (Na(+)-transporting) subunit D [Calditerrivibrio sp.]|nr:NADH:ubiquinone reductase (Na(+)-transporting) subunit D [Calditerrivibrio sp.]